MMDSNEWLADGEVDLDQFDTLVFDTSVYPDGGDIEGLVYVAMGLVGEAGEIANQVKKILRDDEGKVTADRRLSILDELGDVLWYAFALASELDMPVEEILSHTKNKLIARKEEGTLHGR